LQYKRTFDLGDGVFIAFLFYKFSAESFTYEVGDSTPRKFVRKKGEILAMKLMEMMMN
jgi:hypothetical protein